MAERDRKSVYNCRLHLTDLLPLYCRNCDCPICCVCVVTNHKGHDICNVSECVEKKADELNDVIQQMDSSCFDVKLLEENLKKRQESLQSQTERVIRSVEDREREIMAEVRNLCRQTIEQGLIRQEEDVLCRFSKIRSFRNFNDDDCIECVYFYNELKRLVRDQKRNMEDLIPFQFVTSTLSSEHLSELFGCVLTDDHLSSDATTGDNDCEDHSFTDVDNALDAECSSTVSEEEFLKCEIHDYKKSLIKTGIAGIIPISSDRCILYSDGSLYHYNRNEFDIIAENVDHFTYIPETDEIIFLLNGRRKRVFRQPPSALERRSVLITLNCKEILCIGHDYKNYTTIAFSLVEGESCSNLSKSKRVTNYYVCKVNDIGCVLTKQKLSSFRKPSRFKLHASLLVRIEEHQISVYLGSIYWAGATFSYSGCVGIEPSSTFSPTDLCTDPDKNFLIVDSYDNTVHLLDPSGKPLRVIMLAEDGLRGINCVTMDEFNWLWLGCKDGAIHFANYQYFKTTSRKERCLMRQN